MESLNTEHFDGLNARQREAVTHKDGPLLVVAGAGTGKTRVITHRIAHLIAQGVPGKNILAVTFTNKAAAEMRERAMKLLENHKSQSSKLNQTPNPQDPNWTLSFGAWSLPWIGTFHGLGVHILRESGRAVGVTKWFAILDRDESKSIVRRCLKETGYDPKQFEPGGILGAISRAKGDMITREDYRSAEGRSFYGEVVSLVWEKYERELNKNGLLDFDDLLVKTVELLRNYENVRKRYQSQWQYIHVDEYQDTNKVQYEMLRLLASEHMNVCCVGDHDQLIYGWRGASIKNIMGFEEDFPGATVVLLEENYRSTSNILETANRIIAKNENRKEKNLFTSAGAGEKIVIHEAFDPQDEAHFVTQKIARLTKVKPLVPKGLTFGRPEEVAVLYRANFQSRILEEAFLTAGLPYTVMGTRFFERMEVRDILAYVKAALNKGDKASFERAAGAPRRGIGDKSLEDYFATNIANEKIANFINLLNDFEAKLMTLPLQDALKYIVRVSGYEDWLKKLHPSNKFGAGDEGLERMENIQELINLSSKYKNLGQDEALEKFLTDAGLASDQDTLLHEKENKKGVRLSTVHAAKGLEFEHVFIVGLEQDLFPHKPFDDDGLTGEKAEEERRLFYVALTRAKKRLYLSWSQTRPIYGNTMVQMKSEYFSDLDPELIESSSEVGLAPRGRTLRGPEGPTSESKSSFLPDVDDLEPKYDPPDWV